MELSRQEVPLYGQVEVCVVLNVSLSDQEQVEYYVLLEGSSLHHVTRAQKKEAGDLLCFTVPGHNVPERVLLWVYCWDQGSTCGQMTTLLSSEALLLEYKLDDIQEVADLLLSTPDLLTSSKCQEIKKKYCLDGSLQCEETSSDVQYGPSGFAEPEETSGSDQRLHESKEQAGAGRENNPSSRGNSVCCKHGLECRCAKELPIDADVKITQALANIQSHLHWNSQKTQETQDLHCKDTPLHTAVRLGLFHLALFYLQQSGGQKMAALPNREGYTPVELAQIRGDAETISALTNPSAFKEWTSVWMSDVWDDCCHLLRFCPATNSLVLTVKHSTHIDAQTSIQLYREKTRNIDMRIEVKVLSEAMEKSRLSQPHDRSDGDILPADLTSQTILEDCALVDKKVFEDQIISLDEGEEERPPKCYTDKSGSPPVSSSGFQPHCTLTAAARLAAMLNRTRKDDDLHRKPHTSGGTAGSSGMDTEDSPGSSMATLSSGLTDTPQPIQEGEELKEKQPLSRPFSPTFSQFSPTSPAGLVLERFLRAARPAEQAYHSTGSPPDSYELSPSLVALEIDSEEEDDVLIKKPLPRISPDHQSNTEDQDSVKPTSELFCLHAHPTASPCNHTSSKDSGDQGVRLRSYSYSSPKISLLPPRFSRDAHPSPTDLSNDGALSSNSCSSRSLLQALSLSKSLSLLNPVKQRTFSLNDQLQEKREVRFHRRSQSADDETSVELADSLQHLTLSEFLKEIEEEEWDRYIIPSKAESEKHKVSRTFSFIKSCMYSTRNKSKGKWKEREAKDKQASGQQLAAGSFPGSPVCQMCHKLAAGKETLHCTNCTVTIHKGGKDSAIQCLKKVQEKYAVSMVKNRAATLPQNFIVHESTSSSAMPTSASLPVMSPRDTKDSVPMLCPLSRSVPLVPERLTESPEGDSDSSTWRTNVQSEESLTVESFTSTDSSLIEDTVDSTLPSTLWPDTMGLEVESWSLAVEPWFCQRQEKCTIKRQDVIYELMQTELHHLQTLTIMAEVFRRGMRDEVGLDADTIGRVFPCLDELIFLHKDFLSTLRDRRHSSTQPDSNRNYLIQRVGDILLQQFTQENAQNMKQVYGEFCSHHNEAVSFFKELQQQNKKFQLFIKQQSSNSLVKRREIPECILLVTQRITKYPVLLERILQYTEEGTTEHRELLAALAGVRELISVVDMRVSEREQSQRLGDVLARMEGKNVARLKSGLAFRKQDLASGRTLLHHGTLLWKTATGRLKDVLALLLTDLLVFLQEKDQKFIFAAVDQKPPVISLQKLIVREVANEERGMFLISASSAGPEMYEVHGTSKDERNTWMRLIREAVVICHEKEDDAARTFEEERRVLKDKVQKIHRLQETLCGQDQLICSSLEEKLKIYAELSAVAGGGLLVQPGTGEPPHSTALLNAALREAEILRAALLPHRTSSCTPSPLAALRESSAPDTSIPTETLPLSPSPPPPPLPPEREPLPVDAPRDEEEEGGEENLDLQAQNHSFTPDDHNMHLKVCQSVQNLTQLLYSLQAAITIQDSCYEVQRLHLLLSGPAQARPGAGVPTAPAVHERQREASLRQQRRHEEMDGAAGAALERQRQRSEREWQARCAQQEAREDQLQQREQNCHLEAQRLQHEHNELCEQLRDYQQSLERLLEGQRSVQHQRQLLDAHRRLVQGCPPTSLVTSDGQQGSSFSHGHYGDQYDPSCNFVNEASMVTVAMNNRHLHHHQHQCNPSSIQLGYSDSPSAQNSLNSLLAWSSHRQVTSGMPQPPVASKGKAGRKEVAPPSHAQEAWSLGVTAVGFYQGDALSVPMALVSMETENRDTEGEENIVYL
ncbi:rho guanine nucleotide exchange factor 28 isoform X3 [Electrophorus electricus]|uniref:rho guanine nucleotide exchange factor 28 isoform X3 n=1 Tax=Electrophorus electricus TaxID=8005 RepID=UPI0015D024B6|nr:rho guanine nucleotide exchange factor 28 isoform X3 [Electrophorus electricus]